MATILLCVTALLMWFYWARILPERREIVGCAHEHGRLQEAVPAAFTGRMTALVWRCNECPFQVPLPLYRYPADIDLGTLWVNVPPK